MLIKPTSIRSPIAVAIVRIHTKGSVEPSISSYVKTSNKLFSSFLFSQTICSGGRADISMLIPLVCLDLENIVEANLWVYQ